MRIKRGLIKKARHKKVLENAKGYRLSRSKNYRRAKESSLHAGQYEFAHRRRRQSQFRTTWISRLNAALQQYDVKYSTFISALRTKNVELDRKVLAALALDFTPAFEEVVKFVK